MRRRRSGRRWTWRRGRRGGGGEGGGFGGFPGGAAAEAAAKAAAAALPAAAEKMTFCVEIVRSASLMLRAAAMASCTLVRLVARSWVASSSSPVDTTVIVAVVATVLVPVTVYPAPRLASRLRATRCRCGRCTGRHNCDSERHSIGKLARVEQACWQRPCTARSQCRAQSPPFPHRRRWEL